MGFTVRDSFDAETDRILDVLQKSYEDRQAEDREKLQIEVKCEDAKHRAYLKRKRKICYKVSLVSWFIFGFSAACSAGLILVGGGAVCLFVVMGTFAAYTLAIHFYRLSNMIVSGVISNGK